ncbi:nuclear transport factor 2 family protein [Ruegeria lacuscaerulensis]|uniref:nuclear transport factor 2 family protein n=1 Tax=Ruegeria lacuscaerulensis TaxID=55218 RepID=UPI00147A69C1|nr:nuclear transport factor 2 family protein [Ruegeria lacuscaerulensis]
MRRIFLSAVSMVMLATTAQSQDLSNGDKAAAVLQSFQTGDATAMKEYVNPDKYIQHNPYFPDGIAPVIGAVESGAFQGTLVNSYRTLSDGDFAVVQSLYSGAWNNKSPLVAIDVFRFEDGLIVEHWDNMMPLASKPNPSGNTQLDGVTQIVDADKTEANKTKAHDYIDTVLVKGEIDKIGNFVKDDNYIQHHPDIANGVSGLKAALGEFAKKGITMVYDKIHAVHGEGNFVLVMSEGKFAGKPFAYFDLLGLNDGYVDQHWGIMAAIPPASDWKNDNGKF